MLLDVEQTFHTERNFKIMTYSSYHFVRLTPAMHYLKNWLYGLCLHWILDIPVSWQQAAAKTNIKSNKYWW